MINQDIQQQETMRRFYQVPKSEKTHAVSKKAKKEKQCRDRILLIKEAQELGCSVEDLM